MAGRPYPNKHPGTCEGCRAHVFTGAGFITRDDYNDRWILTCSGCTNPLGAKHQSAAGAAPPHEAKASKSLQDGPSKSGDLNRLIKLMKMTTSATDGEALAAMRKANEWLTRAGADWEQMLLGKVSVMADPFTSIEAPPPSPQKAPDRTYSNPTRPTAPPRTRPQTAPPPPPKVDPFDFTIGAAPRASKRFAAKAAAPPRTFTPDIQSSTPRRGRTAPSATDL